MSDGDLSKYINRFKDQNTPSSGEELLIGSNTPNDHNVLSTFISGDVSSDDGGYTTSPTSLDADDSRKELADSTPWMALVMAYTAFTLFGIFTTVCD
jgi:hypothetical protein